MKLLPCKDMTDRCPVVKEHEIMRDTLEKIKIELWGIVTQKKMDEVMCMIDNALNS